MSPKDAYAEIEKKDKIRTINYYANLANISRDPLSDAQLQELNAIVGILQILYDSGTGSPIPDSTYDVLQEELIDMGIPRTTSSVELGVTNKISHQHTNLRGSLDKVYYLTEDEPRTNKSRKYLDEYLRWCVQKIYAATGKKVDMNLVKIMIQPKFDGVSAVEEISQKPIWITRGDTRTNQASDVSHILNIFNDVYSNYPNGSAIKYEVMMSEENLAKINALYRERQYKNSRQIVISIINSNEADFKAEYLYPVPLRLMHPGDGIEIVHPDLISNFPTEICTFGDREFIREFSRKNRYVNHNGMRFRTDGVVMTILDPELQRILGRDNDINKFEIAYKFTEEFAYSKVIDVEFYVSEFSFVTPVVVVNDVILKGNTVNHITLSNRERFEELNLHYGDEVKVLYDIIPYVTIDSNCKWVKNGRKIEFIKDCPRCHEPLDLTEVTVQCKNPRCPSRLIGRVLNYCTSLRIQNIGGQTLTTMWKAGLLEDGIRSLYKFKKKAHLLADLEGFGKAKIKKIVTEIESKRRLRDYDFFGAIGIQGVSTKSFQVIFANIRLQEFLDLLRVKNFDLLKAKLVAIPSIGDKKADIIIDHFQNKDELKELQKLLKELTLVSTYGDTATKGRIVFTGCRPSADLTEFLRAKAWEPSDSWSNKAKYLVVPSPEYTSDKVSKAQALGIPIIPMDGGIPSIKELKKYIPNLTT